ncbi:MAG: DUF3373 family protein [Thermodesulfobacteriota bacterium]|nr:DUF3373 family protein [Thermodesulfobacteriota bacterium]
MVRRFITYLLLGFTIVFLMIPLTPEASSHTDLRLMEEDIAELSNRLDKVETKSILDRVIIGGEFRTRMDYFRYKDTMTIGIKDDANTEDIWSNRLRLNLKVDITDDLVFHGRIACFKLWGESNFDEIANNSNYPSIPDSEGNLHVERAYIDYRIPDLHLSFTCGRLPSSEGPPSGMRENRLRKATWPKAAGDIEMDGLIASIYLDEWTDLENSLIRILYIKVYQNWLEYRGVDAKDSWGPAIVFETQVPNIDNSLMILGHSRIITLRPLEGLPGMTVASIPDKQGGINLTLFHIEFNNINEDGLDWFFTYGYAHFDPSSQGTLFTTGLELGIFGDNLSGNLGESKSGKIAHTGFRYELPIENWKNPKIGFEYNHGSKYWARFLNTGGGELINKLMVNGDAYELYYIQPIDKEKMFLRFGGIYMDFDYENPFIFYGSMTETDMTVTNAYLLLDVLF